MADTFHVGVVSPMSGAMGATGRIFLEGLEWWRDKVNSAGGLLSRDGRRLQVALHLVDSRSNHTLAARQVADFDKAQLVHVHALVNTFTGHNIAINEEMKLQNVRKTLLHCSGGTPAQYGDLELGVPRWGYQFGVMIPSTNYLTSIFKLVAKNGDALPNKQVAFIKNANNPFTSYTCDESVGVARQSGLEVLADEMWEFDGKPTDANRESMAAWVRKLQTSGTQILLGCTWMDDAIMLQEVIAEQRLYLAANIILIGPTSPKWQVAFPTDGAGYSAGDYVLSPSQWHHTQRFHDESSVGTSLQFADEYKNATGSWPSYLTAACTAAGIILERSMSRIPWGPGGEMFSGDALNSMVRDFMEETMYGAVRFNRFNQNSGHDAAVIQVLPGVGQTSVLPESNSASTIVFPMPTWEAREGCPPERPVNDGVRCVASTSADDGNVVMILISVAVTSGGFLMLLLLYLGVERIWAGVVAQRKLIQERVAAGLKSVTQLGHPMVVINMQRFLDLNWAQISSLHEGVRDMGSLLFLDTRERVDRFRAEGHRLVFFSYQWLSWTAKGPNRVQMSCMRSALKTYCKREGIQDTSKVFVWLDILSIPQEHDELKSLAVNSLYAYASIVDALIIIAPDARHEQTGEPCGLESYKSRVWCRVEQLARFCSGGLATMYYSTTESQLAPVSSSWMEEVACVFDGNMTCCRLKHPNGRACDRESLVSTLMGLYFNLYVEHRACPSSSGDGSPWHLVERSKDRIFPKHFVYATEDGRESKRELFGNLMPHVVLEAERHSCQICCTSSPQKACIPELSSERGCSVDCPQRTASAPPEGTRDIETDCGPLQQDEDSEVCSDYTGV